MRRKPSIKVMQTKEGLQIIKSMYNSLGKVVDRQIETIIKKKKS